MGLGLEPGLDELGLGLGLGLGVDELGLGLALGLGGELPLGLAVGRVSRINIAGRPHWSLCPLMTTGPAGKSLYRCTVVHATRGGPQWR